VTILVVDDDPLIRKMTSFLLTRLGYEAEAREGGEQALERLRSGPVAAVLMDCQMPGLDGFQSTRAIRQAGFRLPIIGLTGEDDAQARQRCLEAGMDEYCQKPVRVVVLRTVLGAFLGPASGQFDEPEHSEDPLARVRAIATASGNPMLVERLVSSFVRSTDATVERLRGALHSRQATELQALTHKLKGTAGTFGALEFGRLAGSIEARCLAGEPAAAFSLTPTLLESWILLRSRLGLD
jgi:CheY-like chemotaxis protein